LIAEEKNSSPQRVLKEFKEMDGVGDSFATKHMYFWSKYNDRIDKKFLIYDN